MRFFATFVAGGLALACASGAAQAAQIEYDFAGVGSGFVGSMSFNNANFDFKLFGDTTTVAATGGGVYDNSVTGTFYAGTLSGALTGPLTIEASTSNPFTSFVTLRGSNGTDIVEFSPALTGYNLSSSFALTAASFNGIGFNIPTSSGNVNLTGISNPTFSATVLGTPGPIAGAGLVPLLGLAGAYLFGRKRLVA